MTDYIKKDDKYLKILEVICDIKCIHKDELVKILKDKESRYLLFLLLKKYKCTDVNGVQKDFSIESKKVINNNIKKAEERFFVNKDFRDIYFEAESIIQKLVE